MDEKEIETLYLKFKNSLDFKELTNYFIFFEMPYSEILIKAVIKFMLREQKVDQ